MKILPINKEPYARSYNCIAYPLSIMFATDYDLLPYFLNTHIQVCREINSEFLTSCNFYNTPSSYLDWDCFEKQIIKKYNFITQGIELESFLESSIELGYYLVTHVDEFYINSRDSYMKNHSMHDSLTYGYDYENYYLLGYNEDGKYKTTFVSKREYILSILSNDAMKSSNGYWEGQFMYFLRLKEDFKKDISLYLIKLLIDEYLHSVNSSKRLEVNILPNQSFLFGIKVFEHLSDELLDERKFNIKSIRILYEHKKIMLMRFEFLNNNGLCLRKFYEQYESIYNLANIVLSLSTHYMISRNAKRLNKISLYIKEILEQEKNILHDFVAI